MISELGRSGSGGRGGRQRCEDCAAIDIRDLHRRAQAGRPGACVSWRWNRGGKLLCSIDMWLHEDHVVLADVTDPAQPRTESIILMRTPCHYGGTRPWFCCPGCQQRCAKLYLRRGRFLCRPCHGLGYLSQLEARAERPRLIAHRIRRSLGASSNLLVPFPNKPARMHWRTYYRIRAKGERYEARVFARLAAWLEGRKRR
jgi:hypothetical protein